MLASFTNMNCESQNPNNENPLRFYPLENALNTAIFMNCSGNIELAAVTITIAKS